MKPTTIALFVALIIAILVFYSRYLLWLIILCIKGIVVIDRKLARQKTLEGVMISINGGRYRIMSRGRVRRFLWDGSGISSTDLVSAKYRRGLLGTYDVKLTVRQ